jgi:putative MFS transporter
MKVKIDSYHKKLLLYLSVATFFDGFDIMAITQLLPNFRSDLGLSQAQGGMLIAFINIGAIAAYFLLRATDHFGRRKMLNVTIIGYTLSTFASGLAPNVIVFGLIQFFARMFLIAECSIAMVYVAEEFPADRRGLAMGVIQGSLSLGMIVCAALVPLLLKTSFGWRSVYFAGIIPLILIAIARRSIQESKRFTNSSNNENTKLVTLLYIMKSPYRQRVLQMGLMWAFTYFCTQSAVTFWKEFAVAERFFSDSQVGLAISLASILSMPFVFGTGKFLDIAGRRLGALIIFIIEILAVISCYSFHGFWSLTIALVFGVFGASAVMVVLNTYTTELFPTHLRGNAFAWANSLIGRIGYVISPLVVGYLAGTFGWGLSVKFTVIGLITVIIMILILLPETKAKELEITSQL